MNEVTENKGFIYEFGKFVLDPQERVLLAGGKPIHLTDKVFDTLLLLIQHNGRLLTKDEMMTSIWEESFVEESNLAKNISRLRKILNTDGVELIETLPKRGYRFRADIKEIDGETSLLVRRNLRVKITRTIDNESEPRAVAGGFLTEAETTRNLRAKKFLLTFGALSLVIISVLGFYFWKREKPVLNNKVGAARLTDNPKDDNHPSWTKDGRIRFLRTGSDKETESVVMNADGSNQTEIKDLNNLSYGFWSPDGTKVIFVKRGEKTTLYLAKSDGAGEILLPFFSGNLDWSPDSKQIVYQLRVGEDSDIFVYSLETARSENVSNNPAFDADPSFSPDGKQIVFGSQRDGNAEIYLMNADGSDVRRLTNHPAWDNHPVFSPDGTTIAFDSDRESENSDVYLMNADGSGEVKRLTDWQTNEAVEPGCWSPDGTSIVFYSDREGNDDVFVISAEIFRPRLILADEKSNLQHPSLSPHGKQIVFQAETENKSGELRIFDVETKQSRVVLKTENADIEPVFSPDGTRIAFQNRLENNTEICLIKTDGSGFQNLTLNAARDVSPAFSPDGKQIAFASNRAGNFGLFQLYVMNADGSNPHQIYSGNATSGSPAWSPDGASIVFANDKEDGRIGNYELFKIGLEAGETEKRLTFRRRSDGNPAFSPDGKHIAFVSEADGNSEIYSMNADGTGFLRLTRNAAEDIAPHWSPDGKSIIFSSNRDGKFAIYELEISAQN